MSTREEKEAALSRAIKDLEVNEKRLLKPKNSNVILRRKSHYRDNTVLQNDSDLDWNEMYPHGVDSAEGRKKI